MAWSDLANNQMVSYFDASTSGFLLNSGQSHFTTLPAANQCMTKADALLKYNLNSTFMSSYANLQLVPKTVWVSNVSTFISTWDTRKTVSGVSSASNQIRLPLVSGGSYTFTVNWGDGTSTNVTSYGQIYSGETVARTHTYTTAGVYTISITGTITGWRFQDATKTLLTDHNKILSVQSWGPLRLGGSAAIGYNFGWCDNLSLSNVTDVLNLTGVTSLIGLFITDDAFYLTSINRINEWNTAAITDMSYMFKGQSYFNSSVSNWTTYLVTNMSWMFGWCDLYNQPMARSGNIWNTSAVQSMAYMFTGTQRSGSSFNQDLSSWNVAAVRTMQGMFARAENFNNGLLPGQAGILNWTTTALGTVGNGAGAMTFMFSNAFSFNCTVNSFAFTSAVTSLESTFEDAISFNNGVATTLQFITNGVTSLKRTFFGASAFNQNLTIATNQWNTAAVTNMSETFAGATSFNKNIASTGNIWNTAAVNTMFGMFNGATAFNNGGTAGTSTQPMLWSTANVTNMGYMFGSATVFNQAVNTWNTFKVKQFQWMFSDATSFNKSVSTTNGSQLWNVSANGGLDITMKGMFSGATAFNNGQTPGVTSSLNWGDNTTNVVDMSFMFQNASSFNAKLQNTAISPVNGWRTSNVCSMESMFEGATSFNQQLPSGAIYWRNIYVGFPGTNSDDGQTITGSFESMFARASSFNNGELINSAPIAFPWIINSVSTNVNVATNLSFYLMFQGAPAFNQNISTWTTDRVKSMSYMFDGATRFNGSLASSGLYVWNTSAVTNFIGMFATATAFNGNITNWNTSAAQYMQFMFNYALAFNQNIGSWSTNNVLNMNSMFYGADAFNQNIGSWNISNVGTNSMAFFMGTKTVGQFSTTNLDAIYSGWSQRPANVQNISFFQAKYTSAGQAGRNILTGTRGWTIVDGGT